MYKIPFPVVEPGKPAWKKIKQHFGDDVFNSDGTLNREKLGKIIFGDEAKRKLLNSITHPEIYKAMGWKVISYFFKGKLLVLLTIISFLPHSLPCHSP